VLAVEPLALRARLTQRVFIENIVATGDDTEDVVERDFWDTSAWDQVNLIQPTTTPTTAVDVPETDDILILNIHVSAGADITGVATLLDNPGGFSSLIHQADQIIPEITAGNSGPAHASNGETFPRGLPVWVSRGWTQVQMRLQDAEVGGGSNYQWRIWTISAPHGLIRPAY
jgi:hypothetical protein